MGIRDKISELRRMENELNAAIEDAKKALVDVVLNQETDVEMLSNGENGKPLICIVRFSQIIGSQNWTPEYFMPVKQAEAVEKRLERCRSVNGLLDAIDEMVCKKRVKIGESYCVYLNDKTLEILMSSELWQIAAERQSR